MARRRWVFLEQVVREDVFKHRAPDLHTALAKIVTAIDFDQDTARFTAKECNALRQYIEGMANATGGRVY